MADVVYLAGPITGLPDCNRAAFRDAATALRAAGREVVNPHELGLDGAPWQACMDVCLAQLVRCAEIHLLPGWQHSRGARLELMVAIALGLRIVPIAA